MPGPELPPHLGDRASLIDRARQAATAYYDSVRRAFDRASRDAGEFEQRLQIGDVHVKLRFAGSGLPAVLLPALSPVLSSGGEPSDFEVELWDEATTGVGTPLPPWDLRDVIARGDVRTLSGGQIRAQVDRGNRILTIWDCEGQRGVMWAPDAHRLPYWVPAAPLRTFLHWGLAGPRRHLLHAAAVGDERSGALLVGPAGSGKSTASLACVRSGLGYVGDDCVLVETEPLPRAISVYGTAKLDASSMELLPGLPAARSAPGVSKLIIDVAQAWPGLMHRSVPISIVLVLRVTPGRVCLRPANGAQALRALAPSTILQHPDESSSGLALMSRLVRQVPAYVLELGSDMAAVGPAVRRLLEATP